MGGRACGVLSWVSFLLFPHPLYVVGGVAGWNITPGVERVSARCWVLRRHLAGWWVVFSGGRFRPVTV